MVVGATQGWAADLEAKSEGYQMSGRALLVAPNSSQVLFALATTKAHRWETEGLEALDAIVDSIAFFEPQNPSAFIPCFVHHTPPDLSLDVSAFEDVSCPQNEYGYRVCDKESPLYALGCRKLVNPSNLLGALEPPYPIIRCALAEATECEYTALAGGYQYKADGDCFYRVGGMDAWSVGYVVFREGAFTLLTTEEAFRALFAPIESADEALSYVLAVTGLDASYDLAGLRYTYFVDTIEDTHVERVQDGYLVYLFHQGHFGCGEHPTSSVVLHVTAQGQIEQVRTEKLFKDPFRDGWCMD